MRKMECGLQNRALNQKGVSLIAAVFIIVVLAFMGVVFISFVNTSSFTAINDLQSMQAFSLAEGGVEYAQYALAQNLDWYRSANDPMPAPPSAPQNLGAGSFTVTVNLPVTMLSRRLLSTEINTISVYSTDRFPTSGTLQIDDDAGLGNGEFVQYTGKTAKTFTGGLVRGVTYVGGALGQGATTYNRGARVYPVVFLSGTNLTNNCNTIPNPFLITATTNTTKFLSAGTISVYDRTTLVNEEITYTGSSIASGVMTLTGVRRCQNGTPAATTNTGDPVTPINVDVPASSPDYEAEIISQGIVGSAVRVAKKTVQR